jgi:hypothetical protein
MEFFILAHMTVSGWTYPLDCCSQHDCFEISQQDVAPLGNDQWKIIDTGEIVRAKRSGDGAFHRCTRKAEITGRTICLFVPEFES